MHLPTRQDGIGNRDKVYLKKKICIIKKDEKLYYQSNIMHLSPAVIHQHESF